MIRIHVNPSAIQRNAEGSNEPTMVVHWPDGHEEHCHEVSILGPSKLVYSNEPLHTNARVWIETTASVVTK